MKRRALDAMDLLARLFEVAHADHEGEEEGGDPDEASPGSAPPPGDPRLGMRVLARLIADEARRGEAPAALAASSATGAGAGAPRRRRKDPIRAFAAQDLARVRAG